MERKQSAHRTNWYKCCRCHAPVMTADLVHNADEYLIRAWCAHCQDIVAVGVAYDLMHQHREEADKSHGDQAN